LKPNKVASLPEVPSLPLLSLPLPLPEGLALYMKKEQNYVSKVRYAKYFFIVSLQQFHLAILIHQDVFFVSMQTLEMKLYLQLFGSGRMLGYARTT